MRRIELHADSITETNAGYSIFIRKISAHRYDKTGIPQMARKDTKKSSKLLWTRMGNGA